MSIRCSSVRRNTDADAFRGSLSGAWSSRSSFMMRFCLSRDPPVTASAFFESSYKYAPFLVRSNVPIVCPCSAARYCSFNSVSLANAPTIQTHAWMRPTRLRLGSLPELTRYTHLVVQRCIICKLRRNRHSQVHRALQIESGKCMSRQGTWAIYNKAGSCDTAAAHLATPALRQPPQTSAGNPLLALPACAQPATDQSVAPGCEQQLGAWPRVSRAGGRG
jgi:hypothetical protein